MYDQQVGKFQGMDPEAKLYYDWSPYTYVRDNPVLRLDPTGKWGITVHVYNNREKYGYGIAIVTDRTGKEVFRFKVRSEGVGGRDRTKSNSDTPLEIYDIPNGSDKWKSDGSRAAYGPNARLALNEESGEIIKSGRSDIRVHGGRQEEYDAATGTWSEINGATLKKTHGYLRTFDADMKKLKEIIDGLEKNDSKENGGKLTVTDDLVEINGEFALPNTKKEAFEEYAKRIMNATEKAIQSSNELIKKVDAQKAEERAEQNLKEYREKRNSILE